MTAEERQKWQQRMHRVVDSHEQWYEEAPEGEQRRFARTEANLFTILERLREFRQWNDTPRVAKACSILELSLEIGRREITPDMEIWRAWLMASSISIVAQLVMLDEYPRPLVDALFETDLLDVLYGRRAIVEPREPGVPVQ